MYANHPRMAARWQKHTPKGADLPEKVASMDSVFTAAFLDESDKIASGVGAPVGQSVPTISSRRPKKWFGRESSERTEAAQDLTEARASNPSKARVELAGMKGPQARLVQRLKEKKREARKPGSRDWQDKQNLDKRQAASVSGSPDKHSPAAVEAASKKVRKSPLFSKTPEWVPIPTEHRKVDEPKPQDVRASSGVENKEPGASRAGKAAGKAVRSVGKGAWGAVKAPVMFGSGVLSGLAASKKSPLAERAGEVTGKIVGGAGRFLLNKAKRVARAAATVNTTGNLALRAYDTGKGAVRGLFKKGEQTSIDSIFMASFLNELAKLAASQHSVEYEVGKPPRLVDAFEEFRKSREKKKAPALQPLKRAVASKSPVSIPGVRAQTL